VSLRVAPLYLISAYRLLLGLSFICLIFINSNIALSQTASRLDRVLDKVAPGDVVPGAERFGAPEGSPPLVPVLRGDEVLGHAFLTSDFVDTVGYSGKPIDVIAAIDAEGTILGAQLAEHHEPIVLIGIPESRVIEFMEAYVGYNPIKAAAAGRAAPDVDIVSGATVTVLVIGDSLVRSAARAARRLQLAGSETVPAEAAWTLDPEAGEITDWLTLLGEGSVRRLSLSVGEVNEAFERSGNAKAAARPERGEPEDPFIDLYVALVSHPAVGRSLLGEAEYANLQKMLGEGQHAVLVAGEGRYSFKGSGYVRGGIFDRIELIQGTETVRFRDRLHRRIGDIAAEGAPRFPEIGVFAIPDDVDFDPAQHWRLQLLVQRSTGALERAFTSFEVGYQIPQHYPRRAARPRSAGNSRPQLLPRR
jgi:NosR/NirI family transcriptional regulator, nitrous oxide reductase regulator